MKSLRYGKTDRTDHLQRELLSRPEAREPVPIFDHRCTRCGYTWEAFVHNSAPNPPCSQCKGETAHVLVPASHREPEFRMRSSTEIKKHVTGDIRKLNVRLLELSNRLAIELQKHEVAKTPQGGVLVALFKKAVNTFRGIQRLKSDRLIEESWILLRVLLESHINLIYFMKSDTTAMTRRWADAATLDKLKYMKEMNFFEGTDLAHMGNRESWEQSEAEVIARYSKVEVHAMRRYGYSGLSVEKRAEAIGLLTMYQNCYRIASRSVHTFDPAETGIMDYLNDETSRKELLATRRETLEWNQNLLLGRLAFLLSDIIKDPLITAQTLLLGLGYEKYRDKKDGKSTTESDADPDTFYVWRV
jgi:hypothetical protein